MKEEISRREEQILITIWELKDDAYLVSIKKYLSEVMGKNWTVGAIHKPLLRLEKMGLINSVLTGATAIRGGRSKKVYAVTEKGVDVLHYHKKLNDTLWANFGGLF
ncbi:MAG: PadR family transcriptional regulator [Rhodothermaceae bacterium]